MMSNAMQIVTVTPSTADVLLRDGDRPVSIGTVKSANGRWCWQHRDGEQSSPMSANRSDAATALAEYHRAFKRPAAPVRRFLFA